MCDDNFAIAISEFWAKVVRVNFGAKALCAVVLEAEVANSNPFFTNMYIVRRLKLQEGQGSSKFR